MDIDTQRRLIGQIATDKAFRDALKDKNQIERTLAQNNYPVEPEVVDALKALSPEQMETIARDVEKGFTGKCQ
jgi:restriction endonuclease Mrr